MDSKSNAKCTDINSIKRLINCQLTNIKRLKAGVAVKVL